MSNRVYIIEDHPVFRELLACSLSRWGLEVCGSSADAEHALESLPGAGADLALVDLSLPQMNGFEFAAAIKKRCPELLCVLLSGYLTKPLVEQARALGFRGYVEKGNNAELKAALRDVLAGKSHFPHFE